MNRSVSNMPGVFSREGRGMFDSCFLPISPNRVNKLRHPLSPETRMDFRASPEIVFQRTVYIMNNLLNSFAASHLVFSACPHQFRGALL